MKHCCVALLIAGLLGTSAWGLPIAQWSFDNESDPGRDDSGNGYDLTLEGAPTWVESGCLNFDGANDYLEVDDNGGLSLTSGFKITTKLQISDWPTVAAYRILCKRYDTWGDGYALVINPGGYLSFALSGTEQLPSDVPVPINTEIDITIAWDGPTRRADLYLSYETSSYHWTLMCEQDLRSTSYPFRIASQTQYVGGWDHFKGTICDVTVLPEPASISLLIVGGLALLRKRKA